MYLGVCEFHRVLKSNRCGPELGNSNVLVCLTFIRFTNSSSSSGANDSHGSVEPTAATFVTGIEVSSIWAVGERQAAADSDTR
jgi:hypothetical protein